MKLFLRLLLSPVVLLISLFELIAAFTLRTTSWMLNIVAVAVFVTSIFLFFNDGWKPGLSALVLSWLLSPFGIPYIAQLVVTKTVSFKERLKRYINA